MKNRTKNQLNEDLQTVRDAGLVADKKKNNRTNSKAGLHDKSKNLKDEKRVYKRKPLVIRRKRRILQGTLALSAVLVTSLSVAAYGFLRDEGVGDNNDFTDAGYETVCADYLPEEGKLPTDYTALENVAFMNYRYKNQESWYSEMHSVVSAMGVKQYVDTYKQFSEGVLISQDITVSGLSAALDGARQFCTTADGRVMWRDAACPSSEYNSIYTRWSEDRPLENWSVEEFKAVRGFPHTEFSVYVINENTVLNASEITADGEGNYTFSLTLNHEYDPAFGEKSAVYYYRRQMKETGNLASRPNFYSVNVKYTCDAAWRILKAEMSESYRATAVVAGVNVPSTCSSTSETTFDYLTDKRFSDHYETYYKHYDNPDFYTHPKDLDGSSGSVPEKPVPPEEPTALGYIMDAFGGVMDEGGVFKIKTAFGGGQPIEGVVSLGSDGDLLGDLRVKLGELGAYARKENGSTYLYLEYGGVKARVRAEDLPLDLLGGAPTAEGEENDLLSDLMQQMGAGKLVYNQDKSKVAAILDLKIFGISLPIVFNFDISGETKLINAVASLSFAGLDVDLELSFGTKDDAPEFPSDAEKFVDVNPADFVALASVLTGEYLEIKAEYSGYGAEVSGVIKFCAPSMSLDGNFTLKLDGSGEKNIGIAYADGVVYLTLASAGKEPVKFSADAEQATAMIEKFLGKDIGGAVSGLLPSGDMKELDLAGVLNAVLADGAFADAFTLSEGCRLGVDGTALLKFFGLDFDLGEVFVIVSEGGVLSLEALGAELTVKAGEEFAISTEGYTDLVSLAEGLLSLKDGLSLTGKIDIAFGGNSLALDIERLDVTFAGGVKLFAEVSFELAGVRHAVCAKYDGEVIRLSFDNIGISLDNGSLDEFGEAIFKLYEAVRASDKSLSEKLPELGGAESVKDLAAELMNGLGGFDIKQIINGLQIEKPEDGFVLLTFGGLSAKLALSENAVLSFDASYVADGAEVNIRNAEINEFTAFGEMPEGVNYVTAEELISLAEGLAEILSDGGITLAGSADVTVGANKLTLGVNNLTVKWKDGLSFAFDGKAVIKNVVVEVYLAYENNAVVFIHGGAGLKINLGNGDIDELKAVLTDTYNRVSAALDKMTAGEISGVGSFDEILAKLDTGKSAAELLAELLKALGLPEKDGSADVAGIINAIEFGRPEGGILSAKLGGINLALKPSKDGIVSLDAEARFALGGKEIELNADGLGAYVCGEPERALADDELLTVSQFADMLDYIGATVEVLVQKELTVNVTGTLREHGSVKYDINASLEYSEGEGGYPLQFELGENKSFTLSSETYARLKIAMNARMAGVPSFVIEGYLLDATPAASSGKTQANYTKDGQLDVYLSISKLADGNPLAEPLKIYAPVSEIMTLIAAGGAMLDLDNLDGGEKLQGAVSTLADIVNQLLIDEYLPATKEQFSSLGSSLFKQFVPGGLQEILDNLLKPVGSGSEGGSRVIGEGGFLKNIDYREGALDITLNSSAIYGRNVISDLYFKAEKEISEGKSRLTRLEIGNVYTDNSIKNSLTLGTSVGYAAERVNPSAGYLDARGLDTLLKAVVNSASHKVGVKEDGSADYALNNHYYISGNLQMGLGSLGLFKVQIHGFNVFIDPVTNEVSFDLSVTYPKIDLFGYHVLTQAAKAEITYRGGMVYMRKTPNGKNAEYRVMTAEDFGNDVMGQLTFLFSFGSTITDGDARSMPTANDLGDMLGLWLSSYTTSRSANSFSWNFTLNENTLKQAAGTAISLSVGLNAGISDDGDGNELYTLKSIDISGKLAGIVDVSGSLEYKNPSDAGATEYAAAETKDLSKEKVIDGYGFNVALGGSSAAEITASTKWELLLASGGTRYMSYSAESKLTVKTLIYKFAEDETPLSEQLVLVDGATGVIYTRLNYPDLSGRDEIAGYAKVWRDEYETDANGNLVLRAEYDRTYSVTIESDFAIDGSFEEADGGYVKQFENVHRKAYLPKDKTVEVGGRYYRLVGYTLEGELCEFKEGFDGNGEPSYVAEGIDGHRVYKAVWEEVFKVVFRGYGEDIVRYYGADENVAANAPEVPVKTGHTGSWKIDGTTAAEIGSEVFAEYVINCYTVTLFSEILPESEAEIIAVGEDGERAVTADWIVAEGGYEANFAFKYGSRIKLLKRFADGANLFDFNGYVDAAYATVSQAAVEADCEYKLAWEGKTITVNYIYNGVTPVRNVAADNYQREYALRGAEDANGEYIFLGWWIAEEDGSWLKTEDVSAFAARDIKSITVQALWVKANISGAAYRKSFKSNIFWTKYSYVHVGTVGYELRGAETLVSGISADINSYVYAYYKGESYDTTFAAKDGNGTAYSDYEIEYNTDGYTTDTGLNKNRPTNWYIAAQFTFVYGSGENRVEMKVEARGAEGGYTDI